MESVYNLLLWGMAAAAVVVFAALCFVKAGYGIMRNGHWGPQIPNRAGWVLMEAPVFVAMCLLWWFSPRRCDGVCLVLFGLFQLHYFHRSFVYPFLLKGKSPMPLSIIAMGVIFNVLNAIMQGGWIFYFAPADRYVWSWLATPQFIAGTLIFFAGMGINMHSDYIIRHLRKPGDTGHYLPRGGMFRYVSSANYFGEIVEWTGFAILTWSAAGALFALWTFANLVPRANAIYHRYEELFGQEFTREHRKRVIPFIY